MEARLIDELRPYGASLTWTKADGTWSVRLDVPSNDARLAIDVAVDRVEEAARAVGLSMEQPIAIEVQSTDELEVDLAQPNFPKIAGVAELAARLGVSRQRISALAKSSEFPAPIAELAAGPVWPLSSVEKYAEHWDRRPGRRPSGN